MSGDSRNLGSYGTARNIVPAGTTALLGLTIVMVALACALGTYVLATQAMQQLQSQGYQFWMSTSFEGFFPNLLDLAGSTWTQYLPGQHLALAFTTPPMARAVVAFLGLAVGGITMLVAGRHFDGASRKHPGMGFGIVFIFFGLQAVFQGPPPGITIDLPSQQLTNGGTNLPLGSISGFGTYTHTGRHNHGTDLFVQHDGGETNLASFGYSGDAVTVQSALQNFVSSGGGQL